MVEKEGERRGWRRPLLYGGLKRGKARPERGEGNPDQGRDVRESATQPRRRRRHGNAGKDGARQTAAVDASAASARSYTLPAIAPVTCGSVAVDVSRCLRVVVDVNACRVPRMDGFQKLLKLVS